MSYESAVPVACMLLFGKFIGPNASETRSACLVGLPGWRELHDGVECTPLKGMAKLPRTHTMNHPSLRIVRCGQRGD